MEPDPEARPGPRDGSWGSMWLEIHEGNGAFGKSPNSEVMVYFPARHV